MPLIRFGVLLVMLVLALPACGPDDPEHGLERKGFESTPTGDAIASGFAVTNGETYSADVAMEMRVRQVDMRDGRPNVKETSGRAVLEMTWVLRKPVEDAPTRSTLTMRWAKAEGDHAESFLQRAPIVGSFDHDEAGRTIPRSLALNGGTTLEKREAQNLLVSLLLAGFAGSYAWLPPRPVRVGESWSLEEYVRPRALENLKRYGRETGLATPEPTFEGTGKVRGVVEEDGETWLDVEIEALIEVAGVVSKGTERGRVSMGDRVTGRALISASRGIPKRFEVTHVQSTRGSGGLAAGELDVRSTLRGTVVRTLPGK